MLLSFKQCNPLDFVQKGGYETHLDIGGSVGTVMLVMLDGSNEIFRDVILAAIVDLAAEGKTITDIRYKGKNTRRWFQMVFPAALSPVFFGILDRHNSLMGYLVVNQSSLSAARKVLGIALVKSCRGLGIGYRVFKHVQENLDKMFQPRITELVFDTTRDNMPMMAIARKLGFKEEALPKNNAWGDLPSDRVRFLWTKPGT
ncbi:MAG: GNAT family N-acetyltransferase [Candidatus Sigynarchaeota archaeon]